MSHIREPRLIYAGTSFLTPFPLLNSRNGRAFPDVVLPDNESQMCSEVWCISPLVAPDPFTKIGTPFKKQCFFEIRHMPAKVVSSRAAPGFPKDSFPPLFFMEYVMLSKMADINLVAIILVIS
jgi:hypothetical protein